MNLQTQDQRADVLDVEDLLARCLGNVELHNASWPNRTACVRGLEELEKAVFAATASRWPARPPLESASANASASRLQKHASEIERLPATVRWTAFRPSGSLKEDGSGSAGLSQFGPAAERSEQSA